jgi:hypothetical protein
MNPRYLFVTLLGTLALAQPTLAAFEAHEWGTFTSLVGSNGISQNGMYHEDEQLPAFVHGFGVTQRDIPPPFNPPRRPCHNKGCFGDDFFNQNVITQKMETPVIYFYSDQLRSVDVNVRFPEGVVTETFPAPVSTSPTSGSIRDAANGNTTFHVDVLPTKNDPVPFVAGDNIYAHARAVDSNIVRSGREQEKFIFYRGIGRFQPRLGIGSYHGGLGIDLRDTNMHPSAIFLVHVNEQGDGQLTRVVPYYSQAELSSDAVQRLSTHTLSPQPGILRGADMQGAMITALQQSGLNLDEATAMIKTWENGYLKVPGLRFLYVLPRAEVDEVLPLTITPAPDKVVRVFVGRIEVLLDTEEQKILDRVLAEKEAFDPKSLGRFAEPMLRRVLEVFVAQGHAPDFGTVHLLNELIRKAAAGN